MSSATTNMMVNLPFDLTGKVYCGPHPGTSNLTGFAEELTNKKISTVVMLATANECGDMKAWYEGKNIKVIHFPIIDSKIPTDPEGFANLLTSIEAQAKAGDNIYMHCRTGSGRTGMVAACLAKQILNISGQKALEFVKTNYPKASPNIFPQKTFIVEGYKTHESPKKQVPEAPKKQTPENQPTAQKAMIQLLGMSVSTTTLWHELPFGLNGKIYRTSMPASETILPLWKQHLNQSKVSTIVVLAPQEEIGKQTKTDLIKWYQENGFKVIHMPIPDSGIPMNQVEFIDVVHETLLKAQAGENVAIHCRTGMGRTGMFSIALTQHIKHNALEEAAAFVNNLTIVQLTPAQKKFLQDLNQGSSSSSSSSSSSPAEAKEKEKEELKEQESDNGSSTQSTDLAASSSLSATAQTNSSSITAPATPNNDASFNVEDGADSDEDHVPASKPTLDNGGILEEIVQENANDDNEDAPVDNENASNSDEDYDSDFFEVSKGSQGSVKSLTDEDDVPYLGLFDLDNKN